MLKFSIAGSVMAVVHLAILGYTVALIVGAGQPDWPMYWTIFLALDFPVSLAVVPLAWIFPPSPAGPLHDFANFWWPLAIHGLFGTLWWYIVGTSIGDRLSRFRTPRAQKSARKSGRL
jgi:hypothetical protein